MIKKVINIAQKAADAIMNIYTNEKILINLKDDESPITQADELSHQIICKGLKEFSTYPIMSEENIIPYSKRKKWEKFWLIDPLDGTKDFIAKNDEFTINIALIENHKPVLGLVFIPASKDIYWAELGKGAYKNGKRIYNHSKREALIAADSNFYSTKEMKNFFKKHNINEIKKIGSSIKLCFLAEGLIDVYPRLNETKEWDTAAAHLIANEAGCKLIDIKTNKELIYNKESYRNNYFIASRNNLEFKV